MNVTFKAIEDIKKGEIVVLNFEIGEISVHIKAEMKPNLQLKEEPNIIEGSTADRIIEVKQDE